MFWGFYGEIFEWIIKARGVGVKLFLTTNHTAVFSHVTVRRTTIGRRQRQTGESEGGVCSQGYQL